MRTDGNDDVDRRRKLRPIDYSLIRLYSEMDFTTREIASEYGVSTKFIKKIQDATIQFGEDGVAKFVMTDGASPHFTRIVCSGCGMGFPNESGRSWHYEIWSSGFTKPLGCSEVMPGIGR